MDPNDDYCFVCIDEGELICCEAEGCSRSYHITCLDPPLVAVPEGTWMCPDCSNPLAKGLEKILAARKVNNAMIEATTPRRKSSAVVVEFYVKMKERPYRECRWVREEELESVARVSLGVKYKLNHWRSGKVPQIYLEPPPIAGAAAAGGADDSTSGGDAPSSSPLRAEELRAVAIDPAWLEVERIVTRRRVVLENKNKNKNKHSDGDHHDDEFEYLVKWRKLDYDACTGDFGVCPERSSR